LHALSWALRLRLSWPAMLTPSLGAIGLATMPWLLTAHDARSMTSLVALWLFALFALGLWTPRRVSSSEQLDEWGRTVLARSLRAAWILWAVLLLFHVDFWAGEYGLTRGVVLPVSMLLATRWLRRELSVWCLVGATLFWAGLVLPQCFSAIALMAAAIFALRALRKPTVQHPESNSQPATVAYRARHAHARAPSVDASVVFRCGNRASIVRLLTGSVFCAYLSLWTLDWAHGSLPDHILALDLLLGTTVAALVWRTKMWIPVFPLAANCIHFAVQARLIEAPRTVLGWGATCVAVGFCLLATAVGTSWRFRDLAASTSSGGV
jgi:hypothetical protein